MSGLLIAWDRLIMAVTREDELCDEEEHLARVGDRQVLGACARRWAHPGRHVWRPYQ